MDIEHNTSPALDHCRKSAIGTTALALLAATPTIRPKKGVTLHAPATNTTTVYVGNADVTADAADATDGIPLPPGATITLPVDDPSKLFLVGSAAGPAKIFAIWA